MSNIIIRQVKLTVDVVITAICNGCGHNNDTVMLKNLVDSCKRVYESRLRDLGKDVQPAPLDNSVWYDLVGSGAGRSGVPMGSHERG